MIYHVKSLKKNGTYFGRFKSLEDAQEAADKAIMDDKYGADDWEPEEKAKHDWPQWVADYGRATNILSRFGGMDRGRINQINEQRAATAATNLLRAAEAFAEAMK